MCWERLRSGGVVTPRELLIADHRPLFGKAEAVRWRTVHTWEEQVAVRAAKVQHEQALRFRRLLKRHHRTMNDFARDRFLNAESVRRKLRGETWASLRDLATWAVEYDPEA